MMILIIDPSNQYLCHSLIQCVFSVVLCCFICINILSTIIICFDHPASTPHGHHHLVKFSYTSSSTITPSSSPPFYVILFYENLSCECLFVSCISELYMYCALYFYENKQTFSNLIKHMLSNPLMYWKNKKCIFRVKIKHFNQSKKTSIGPVTGDCQMFANRHQANIRCLLRSIGPVTDRHLNAPYWWPFNF